MDRCARMLAPNVPFPRVSSATASRAVDSEGIRTSASGYSRLTLANTIASVVVTVRRAPRTFSSTTRRHMSTQRGSRPESAGVQEVFRKSSRASSSPSSKRFSQRLRVFRLRPSSAALARRRSWIVVSFESYCGRGSCGRASVGSPDTNPVRISRMCPAFLRASSRCASVASAQMSASGVSTASSAGDPNALTASRRSSTSRTRRVFFEPSTSTTASPAISMMVHKQPS